MTLPEAVHRSVEEAVTAQPVDGVRLLRAIQGRRRARWAARRRLGIALVASAASVTALAALPTLLTSGSPPTSPATAPPDSPATAPPTPGVRQTRAYDVALASRTADADAALATCLELPGVGPLPTSTTAQRQRGEVAHRIEVTGRQHFGAFAACIERVPEAHIAQTTTSPGVTMPGVPGHPEDVQVAEICQPSNAYECHAVFGEQAVELALLFADAQLARPGSGCEDPTGTYTVMFDARRVEPPGGNRLSCGTIAVAGQLWEAGDALTDAVRRQYAVPTDEVRTLTDQCVGSDRPEPDQAYIGLSTEQGTALARSRGLDVLVLGEQGCLDAQVGHAPGRIVLVVDEGRVVWAAPR